MTGSGWQWNILDVRYFTRADCNSDCYVVIRNIRQRLSAKKEYQIGVSNRVAALETLSDCEDINRAWAT
jgi:hypothetical protein